ncbi:glutathionylspermidine synthase like protein [Minicystis rosea]|nr:glutathionylspermidine synthase like protein [Minicystis rosea]
MDRTSPPLEAEVRALAHPDPLSEPSLSRDLREKYLVWDAFFAGERRVDVLPLVISDRLHRGAVAAAEATVAAIEAVAARAHADPEEAARYGYHPDTTRLVSASWSGGDRTSFVRVDLLLGEDGVWRACEVNADCPGGHNEAYGLPRLARDAGFVEGSNPTTVVEDLASRLAELARDRDGTQGPVGMTFATAWSEDLQICALLKRTLSRMGVGAVFAPPTAPRLTGDSITLGGKPVRVLYRYFPTEYMEGQENLEALAVALSRGQVRSVPSFSTMYAQSKLAFARAWALRAELAPEHRAAIERYLPETVDVADLGPEPLLADREGWVLKRALGRVGDQVFVGALTSEEYWRGLVEELFALAHEPDAEPWIAQRIVRQRPIPTPFGDRLVTLGAYVLDGRFVGYFARITSISHVSHDALCIPVFVADPVAHAAPSGGIIGTTTGAVG